MSNRLAQAAAIELVRAPLKALGGDARVIALKAKGCDFQTLLSRRISQYPQSLSVSVGKHSIWFKYQCTNVMYPQAHEDCAEIVIRPLRIHSEYVGVENVEPLSIKLLKTSYVMLMEELKIRYKLLPSASSG